MHEIFVVEYRDLLGDWWPDKRPFSREDALAQARKIRQGDRQHNPHLARQTRVRIRRSGRPAPPRLVLTDAERFHRVEAVLAELRGA